jgi:hypothetical protein
LAHSSCYTLYIYIYICVCVCVCVCVLWAGIHQSVLRLATGWTVRRSNPIGGGAIFSAPVQTGPRVHPTSYTMVTGSFFGIKRPGRGADHLHPPNAEVEGRVQLPIYSPSGPSWPVLGRTLPLPLYIYKYIYIIAQQYSSATFASSHFDSRMENSTRVSSVLLFHFLKYFKYRLRLRLRHLDLRVRACVRVCNQIFATVYGESRSFS